jgi:hypothetical protein
LRFDVGDEFLICHAAKDIVGRLFQMPPRLSIVVTFPKTSGFGKRTASVFRYCPR